MNILEAMLCYNEVMVYLNYLPYELVQNVSHLISPESLLDGG